MQIGVKMRGNGPINESSRSLLQRETLKTLGRLLVVSTFILGLHVSPSFSQTVLWQCTFDESGATAAEVVAKSGATPYFKYSAPSIVAGGHDGRKAISWYYPNSGYEMGDGFQINIANKPQITFVYWEKFDVDPSKSDIWNVKSTRAYTNVNGGGDFIGALVSLWGGQMWQQGNFGSGKLTVTSNANNVITDPVGYCPGSGPIYNCPNGRLSLNWSPGFGTSWHKIRIYYKVPSSVSAANGVTMLWIDENLIYTLSNISGLPTWSPYIVFITVHPSDDFFQGGLPGNRFPFHHLYDDMTVYDGLVPPTTGISSTNSTAASTFGARVLPFHSRGLRFSVNLLKAGDFTLRLIDAAGREVYSRRERANGGGMHAVEWNAASTRIGGIANGLYFLSLEQEGNRSICRLPVVQ